MVQTKQTNRKQSTGRQGSPAKFPKKGKPSGKAAKHLAVATDDSSERESSTGEDDNNNNNIVNSTVRAGRKRRSFARKARIYQRPKGVCRKYRPGVGSLHEIRHYQREYGVVCSKIACARLFENFVKRRRQD